MRLTTTNFQQHHTFMDQEYRDYVGQTGEELVAELFEGLGITFHHTPNRSEPLDFYLPGIGIEVKTMAAMKHHEVVISKVDRAKKERRCKVLHIEGYTLAVSLTGEAVGDDEKEPMYTVQMRYKPGFKRFRVPHMLDFGEGLLWDILEMQDLVEVEHHKLTDEEWEVMLELEAKAQEEL